ncbi:hypothetical protein ElyMa_004281600 [Elysia marginata]|uniref:Collagen IV NC1 domain-containing protein n=1 Tax=Elysia marginata TaxID=1093978 RepID=A0AAV4GV00_9GAST|nr:hypothetical protein ElyMa_004281600 [Elysia marginata]
MNKNTFEKNGYSLPPPKAVSTLHILPPSRPIHTKANSTHISARRSNIIIPQILSNAFSHLKGLPGAKGDLGPQGPKGENGFPVCFNNFRFTVVNPYQL